MFIEKEIRTRWPYVIVRERVEDLKTSSSNTALGAIAQS